MKSTAAKQGVKQNIFSKLIPIQANDSGDLPKEIEILQVGMWDTPWHGMFMVTPEHLQQYIDNFKADVRAHSSSVGLPIDREHQIDGGAAAWIKKLFLKEDSDNPGQQSLWGSVEWSATGAADLKAGLYKFFSPTFCPTYEDPEGKFFTENVLEGGALTTKPLFKGLTPVMASEKSDSIDNQSDRRQTIYISANSNKESNMTLEEIRAKDATVLTDQEREYLADNKDQLTADEKVTYGFADKPATPEKPEEKTPEAVTPEVEKPVAEATPAPEVAPVATPIPVTASDKGGAKTVTIEASALAALQNTAAKFETKEAQAIIDAHIARGAITASERDANVSLLMDADTTLRPKLEEMFSKLPENKVLANEIGTGEKPTDKSSAAEQIMNKANQIVEASEGKTTIGAAISQVRKENTDLAKQADNE